MCSCTVRLLGLASGNSAPQRGKSGRLPAAHQGNGEPVSSMVFRLAKTAGQPAETPRRTRLPGEGKPAVGGGIEDHPGGILSSSPR
jgi:hypothetical protein